MNQFLSIVHYTDSFHSVQFSRNNKRNNFEVFNAAATKKPLLKMHTQFEIHHKKKNRDLIFTSLKILLQRKRI